MSRTLIRAEFQIDNTGEDEESYYFLRADGSAPMTADFHAGTKKIVNVANPTLSKDLATKEYVDGIVPTLDVKKSVRVRTSENIENFNTPPAQVGVINPITLAEGDRILVGGQTNAVENGIYVLTSGVWIRASDANDPDEVNAGMFTFVTEGDYEDSGWVLVTDDPITVGVTDLEFTQFSGIGMVRVGDGIRIDGSVLILDVDDTLEFEEGKARIVIDNEGAITLSGAGLGLSFNSLQFRIEENALEMFNSGLTPSGQVLLSNAAGLVTYTSLSGDVTVSATGTIEILTTDNTIDASDENGIRLTRAEEGKILIGQGIESEPLWKEISGDGTIFMDGSSLVFQVSRGFLTEENFIIGEVPAGEIDGENTDFSLEHIPLVGSEMIFLNGVLQDDYDALAEVGDYNITGRNFSFLTAPESSSTLIANYLKPYAASDYKQVVFDIAGSDLNLYFPMDEESGTTMYDHSGNESHGVYGNHVTLGADSLVAGGTGTIRCTASANPAYDIARNSFTNTVHQLGTGSTLAYWIQMDTPTATSAIVRPFLTHAGTGSSHGIDFSFDNRNAAPLTATQQLFATIFRGSSSFRPIMGVSNNYAITTTAPHFVALTWAGTSATFYVNGVAWGTASGNSGVYSTSNHSRANASAIFTNTHGSLQHLMHIKRSLLMSEINALYLAGMPEE